MRKIKILQVNKLYYPSIGGIERVVQDIAEGLKDEVDMEVLVCQPKGKGADEVLNGIRIRRCSSFGTLFSLPLSINFLWELRRRSKEKDIIQFHAPFPLGDLGCLLSGYKGKVVLYWHSDVVKQKKLMLLYRPIMERFLKRADAIIVSTEGIINGSSYLKPYKNKCIIIPFAVDKQTLIKGKEYICNRIEVMSAPVKFLFVGRLVYYKGVDVMLRAFIQIKNAELTIIGTGILENELKELVQNSGASQRVHFRGKVSKEDLYKAYETCDVLVLPSVAKSEAFGLVQIEAMAFGKPVINTNLPSGVPEVSLNGITGLTIEPGDENELREAMNWLVMHPDERDKMGKAARGRVDENYTMDAMMCRMMHAYKRVLGDKQL